MFANSLSNGFTYDDNPILVDNPRVQDLTNLREIWLTDWWRMPIAEDQPLENPTRDRLYRPLTIFTFAVNYAMHGLEPFGFHLVNLLLHALTTALVWHLARRLLGSTPAAAAAALLFAVHPVHCEAVANVVGRAELLAALFMTLGLLAILPQVRPDLGPAASPTSPRTRSDLTWGRVGLCGICLLLALFAKETAVAFVPVALIGLAWLRPPAGYRAIPWARVALALVPPLLVYFPLRFVALEERLVRDEVSSIIHNPLIAAVGMQRVTGALSILGEYARLLLVPAKLVCDYGLAAIDPTRGPDPITWVGLLAAVAGVVGLAGLARPPGLWRTLGFTTAMFAASYVLISNTVLLIGTTLGERLMYWPSVPFVLAIGALVGHAASRYARAAPSAALVARQRSLRLLGAALLAVLALRSFVRNADWQSDLALFQADVVAQPRSAHIKTSLILTLLNLVQESRDRAEYEQLVERCAQLADQVLQISPRLPTALRQRGTICMLQGDREGAIKYFESGLRINPSDRLALRMLNAIRKSDDSRNERIQALRSQLATRPAAPALRLELGRLLLQAGDPYAALLELKQAADLAPLDPATLKAYADALTTNFQDAEARAVLERAVQLAPDDWEIHNNLTTLYGDKEPRRALEHARSAFRLQPNDLRVQVNLAEALVVNGDIPAALERYRIVAQAVPRDDPFHAVVQGRMAELRRIP